MEIEPQLPRPVRPGRRPGVQGAAPQGLRHPAAAFPVLRQEQNVMSEQGMNR